MNKTLAYSYLAFVVSAGSFVIAGYLIKKGVQASR